MLQRFWGSIREPRHLKVVYWCYYLLTVGVGLATQVMPPNLVESQLGYGLALTFSVLLVLGGLAGAASVFPGWWWAERLACWAILLALAIFALVVGYLTVHGRADAGATQLGIGVLASGMFVIRVIQIRKYSFEPRPERG